MKTRFSSPFRILIITLAGLCLLSPTVFAVDYTHTIRLKKMTFAWNIQGEKLYVKLTGDTTSWVGIGFNPSYKMKDANYILGYVKRGRVKVSDAFGVREKEHIRDTAMRGRNDVTEVSGSEKDGITTIEFAMPMNSTEATDGKLDPNAFTEVLLAYGKNRDSFFERHSFRTSLRVNLSTGQYR